VPLACPDLLFGIGAGGQAYIVLLQPEQAIGIIVGRFVLAVLLSRVAALRGRHQPA
jgi:hypothetical protein